MEVWGGWVNPCSLAISSLTVRCSDSFSSPSLEEESEEESDDEEVESEEELEAELTDGGGEGDL